MLRILTLALAVATLSTAPTYAAGTYTMDAQGACHDPNGQPTSKDKCMPPPSKRCRNMKARYVKCPPGCSLSSKDACRGMTPLV
jgi:hypothetical protein